MKIAVWLLLLGFFWMLGTATLIGAVRVARENITIRNALFVAFVALILTLLPIGGLVGMVAVWCVIAWLLSKLSSVDDIWPAGITVAFVNSLFFAVAVGTVRWVVSIIHF